MLFYADGEKRYILAPEGLKAGDEKDDGPDAPPNVGNAMPLRNIPLAWRFHNIEIAARCRGKLCRSAGSTATLMAREAEWAQVTLPSARNPPIPATCRATIGTMGNSDHMNVVIGKAAVIVGRVSARPFAAQR